MHPSPPPRASFTASSLLLPHHPLLAVIVAGLGGMLCFLLTGTHEILGGLEKARDRERREQRDMERREQTALSATPRFPPCPIFSCATLGSQSGFVRVLFCKRDLFLYCKNIVFILLDFFELLKIRKKTSKRRVLPLAFTDQSEGMVANQLCRIVVGISSQIGRDGHRDMGDVSTYGKIIRNLLFSIKPPGSNLCADIRRYKCLRASQRVPRE